MQRIKTLSESLVSRRLVRWSGFLMAWSAIGVIWLLILPHASSQPSIHARLEEQAAQGIDPSAMFYSELPLRDDVISRLDEFHRRYPAALWHP